MSRLQQQPARLKGSLVVLGSPLTSLGGAGPQPGSFVHSSLCRSFPLKFWLSPVRLLSCSPLVLSQNPLT